MKFSQCSLIEKTMMRRIPVKNVGTEKPTYAPSEIAWSSTELRRIADRMPAGSAMSTPTMYATPTTARVFGSRCQSSADTDECDMNEIPKSPWIIAENHLT